MSDEQQGDGLPFDSDVEVDDVDQAAEAAGRTPGRAPTPVHHRLPFLLLVGAGGAAGTLVRFLLQQAIGSWSGVPVVTVVINMVGAFLLGFLLETLVRRGDDRGRRRMLRLLLGTGALGGFTTYSALSVDTLNLLREGLVAPAVAYALGTVVLGAVATVLGIAVGARAERADRAAGATR